MSFLCFPVISIIIPAHNESAWIERSVGAARDAAEALGEPFEIIVVNDASTDGTARLAAAAGAKVIDVDLRQIGAVRNAGAKHAAGDLLVFVDADTILPPAVLRDARRAVDHGAIGGGAPVAFDRPLDMLWARFMLGLWNVLSRFHRWAAGCFLFVRRDAFLAVGGFDEKFFAAEELILSDALKRRGPFTILRHPVVSSARKMNSGALNKHFSTMLRTILTGGRALQKREGLELWYDRPNFESPEQMKS